MVWGLVTPWTYGKFFPGVDYVGWDDEVEAWLRARSMVEGKNYVPGEITTYKRLASEKFTRNRGPLALHEQPKAYRARKKCPDIASTIELNGRLIAVDEVVMAVIETFEPGVHQFWPIELSMPGRQDPLIYYGLIIRQFRDSFLPEESTVQNMSRSYYSDDTKAGMAKLTVSGGRIGNAHLWREEKLQKPNILMSDALQEAIAATGVTVFKHYRLKVV